jgi:predicted transcriptional regulator of viral defense system
MKGRKRRLQDYLLYLQSQGQFSFLREEAMAYLDIEYPAFTQSAHRLIKKGRLNRVKGEFYTIVPPEYQVQGSLPAHWFINALMGHLKQDYYVALLSAAAWQGATHQLTSTFQVLTDKPMPAIQTGHVCIEFLYKKKIKPHYYKKTKTEGGMVNISIPEMTACDLLRYVEPAGHINHIATVLYEMGETLKPEILAQLLEQNDIQITAAQRLGFLLETLEIPIDLAPLISVLKTKGAKRRLLVAGSEQAVIEYNKRWHILVNEIVEPDEL